MAEISERRSAHAKPIIRMARSLTSVVDSPIAAETVFRSSSSSGLARFSECPRVACRFLIPCRVRLTKSVLQGRPCPWAEWTKLIATVQRLKVENALLSSWATKYSTICASSVGSRPPLLVNLSHQRLSFSRVLSERVVYNSPCFVRQNRTFGRYLRGASEFSHDDRGSSRSIGRVAFL
ncbi:MAG: hypothetical protein ACJAWL_001603 [Motiliproteus sp.]|jgi:hypothetical protein